MRHVLMISSMILILVSQAPADTPDGMVRVPVDALDSFTMGDSVAECGAVQHEVTLTRDYYLGQHEVTN